MEERLVIDWGGSTLSWCQSRLDKDVVKILQIEQKVFPGYEKVILKFGELENMVNNPAEYRQWEAMLTNVYGVYLILDMTDGRQYVGSA